MRIRQSFAYPQFTKAGATLELLFEAAGKIGYDATEMFLRGDDFLDVVALARRNGLAIASMGGHASLRSGLNDSRNHERIEAELRASIEAARDHQIPNLVCLVGNEVEGQSDADGLAATIRMLRKVAPYAEQHAITLNVEMMNTRVDHPGYQGSSTAFGLAICDGVGSDKVKILYDIYHMQIMEGDVIRTLRDNIGRIGHIHTAGNPGRNNLDDRQELNYAAICRAIAATGYRGYVGHEFNPKGDIVASLRQAFEVCDQDG